MLKIKKTLLLALLTFLFAGNLQTAKPKKRYKAKQKTQTNRLSKNRKARKKAIKKQEKSSYISWVLGGSALVLVGVLLFCNREEATEDSTNRMGAEEWTNFKKNHTPGSVKKIMEKVNARKIKSKAVIAKNSNIIKGKSKNNIHVTQLNYADPKIFTKLGHKPKDIILVNGANNTLSFGLGGTNGALSKLIQYHTGYKEWGNKKDTKEKTFTKEKLDVGEVVLTTTKRSKGVPQITIAHILGPGSEDDDPKLNDQLEKGMKELLEYAIRSKKHLVICPAGIGIFCDNDKQANDRYESLIKAIESVLKDKKLKKQIYLNMWHKDVVKNITNKK